MLKGMFKKTKYVPVEENQINEENGGGSVSENIPAYENEEADGGQPTVRRGFLSNVKFAERQFTGLILKKIFLFARNVENIIVSMLKAESA